MKEGARLHGMSFKTKLFFLIALLVPCWIIASHLNVDLVVLYETLQRALREPHTAYSVKEFGRFFYGPVSLVLFRPLSFVSFSTASWIWIGAQTIAFVGFWWSLSRLYPFLREPETRWSFLLVLMVSINPIHNNFQSGNIQLMIAAVLFTAECLTRSKKPGPPFLGGLLCALVSAIKVFPLFVALFYFLCKTNPVRKGLIAGFALSALIPFLFFGFPDGLALFQGFFKNLTAYHVDNPLIKIPDILCLPSFMVRLFGHDHWLVQATVASLALAFFSSAFFYARKLNTDSSRERTHLFALALAFMTFLNSSTRPHYFIFYVPAFCSIVEILRKEHSAVVQGLLALSTLLIAFTVEGVVGKSLNDRLESLSIPTVGMLFLCGTLTVLIAFGGVGNISYRDNTLSRGRA